MKVPLNWLNDYVDISDIEPKKLADGLTLTGSKVETIEELGREISNVVVGKILTLEKHPDADKLQVSKVDVGTDILQVVTGASNVKTGDIIPVAKHGALLPGDKKITRGKLRGVESQGMMCSIQELGLTKYDYPEASEHGIFVLNGAFEPGTDIKEVLGLNDTVFEFEITPNRPDCLSIIGIARETAVTFGRELKKNLMMQDVELNSKNSNSRISIEIKASELCNRYIGRIVRNIKIGSSPEWMRKRLKAAGMRPINNIVDVTNYVMLELGQPMHAFDFDKIEGGEIIVRRAKDREVMVTLDEQKRELNTDMLVIADANKAVAVAGVMGGANSEITEATTTILLESANFKGSSVRLTAKALGFRTEASARYEKGLDIENTLIAMNRAVELLEEIGVGKAEESYVDCYPVKRQAVKIKFRPDKINTLLGTQIDTDFMIKLFKSLELEVDKENMSISVPSFRADIEGEADLAEEIARFYGYNNIKSSLFSGETTQGRKTQKQRVEDMCKYVMIAQGFSEIYTYSMTSPKSLDMIRIEPISKLRDMVEIANPLSEEQRVMRTTTIPSMLEVLARNYSRRIPAVRLFESSLVYIPRNLPLVELPEEKKVLTIGMYGDEDFYSLKGVVEELLVYFGISDYQLERKEDNAFHPGRTAEIKIAGQKAGIIGEVHPVVIENYGLNTRVYLGIIELDRIISNLSLEHKYQPLPKYPAVDRDIAMVVKENISAGQIEEAIKLRAGKLLKELELFDVYKGDQIIKGYKSIAYSLKFRANDRTLTDEEVNKVMESIMRELKNNLGAELRQQ